MFAATALAQLSSPLAACLILQCLPIATTADANVLNFECRLTFALPVSSRPAAAREPCADLAFESQAADGVPGSA